MNLELELIMTPEEQLERWVQGTPVHNGRARDKGECCPDFSCCNPHLLQPLEVREAFARAGPREREQLLMTFLSGLTAGHNVYLTGGSERSSRK